VGSGDIMQARWGSHGDCQVIALCPWSVQEAYEMTIRAFNLAETYRVPVFLLTEEAIGHLREKIEITAVGNYIPHAQGVDSVTFG